MHLGNVLWLKYSVVILSSSKLVFDCIYLFIPYLPNTGDIIVGVIMEGDSEFLSVEVDLVNVANL